MTKSYINKVKANITVFATKKTSNILDGTYKSIFKGRSMNFEDLREYVVGDNVKDIDWKASARTNNLLVRQYIAEKKHNIMLILDTGKKMIANTPSHESKKELSILVAGTIAYIANKNGDYVGAIYNKNNSIEYFPFKTDLYNIEKILSNYDKDVQNEEEDIINKSLEFVIKHIKKRMIIFIITDLDGLDKVKEANLRKIATVHDILLININDAYLTDEDSFDVENQEYIPKFLINDKKIFEIEKQERKKVINKSEKKLKKCKMTYTTVENSKEITEKIIDLLERHRNANNGRVTK